MDRPTILEINKAKVILYPIKQFPSVYINTLIKSGSWYEEGPKWGAFHYLEHLIFQGSLKYPTNQQVEKFKQQNGINCNASTGNSNMCFWFNFPDFKINQGLELFKQLLFNPIFSPKNFQKELSVIAQEYYQYWDSPHNRFYQKIDNNILGPNNFLNRHPVGQPEFIKTLSQTDLVSLHSKYFQPQNMVITIVGNFDIEKTKDKLNKIFSKAENNFQPKLPKTITNIETKKMEYQDTVDRAYLVLSWVKKKKYSSQQRLSLNAASFILANSTNSILFQKIRQKLALVYDISSKFYKNKDIRFFEIWASSETKNLNPLINAIQIEIKKFLNAGISQEVFDKYQQYMNYRTLMGLDSLQQISDNFSSQLFYDKTISLPQDFINIANKITLSQFMDTVKDIINPQETIVSTMTPIKPEQ
jgi:predicted Zn-dependent peptidase